MLELRTSGVQAERTARLGDVEIRGWQLAIYDPLAPRVQETLVLEVGAVSHYGRAHDSVNPQNNGQPSSNAETSHVSSRRLRL